MNDTKTLERIVRKLLIYNARQRYGRTHTAAGLRETWTRYKRTSITPHLDFQRFLKCYWELRDGCH